MDCHRRCRLRSATSHDSSTNVPTPNALTALLEIGKGTTVGQGDTGMLRCLLLRLCFMSRRRLFHDHHLSPSLSLLVTRPLYSLYSTVAMSEPVLKIKKLSENAKVPTRGSENAAGYDLYA
jgi:hypothetical protein